VDWIAAHGCLLSRVNTSPYSGTTTSWPMSRMRYWRSASARRRLSVRHEDAGGPLRRAAYPADQLVAIRMRGHALQLYHLGAHREPRAVDLHDVRATDEHGAPRTRGLIAGEDDHVARIGSERLQVMQNATAAGHAAGRDDDHGAAAGIEALRLLDRVHEPGGGAHGLALRFREQVLAQVLVIESASRPAPSGC
jgi:hypothetical protein